MYNFYCYNWSHKEIEGTTRIKIFGLDENNQSVYVYVDDFTPYVYLELPNHIDWNGGNGQKICSKIDELCGKDKPLKKTLVYKKKLYYANKTLNREGKLSDQLFPFLCLTFTCHSTIKKLTYRLTSRIYLAGIGNIQTKIHESNANPILQLTCYRNITPTGWISIQGTKIPEEDKESSCDHEFKVSWKNIYECKRDSIVRPLIMSFDIEVNSSNPNTMPNPNRQGDKIFQISCVFGRNGDTPKQYDKFLLTLGEPDHKTVGEDVEIRCFETESDLLEGYTELIQEKNPNIIIGYNIFQFDIPYMIDRAKLNMCMFKFDQQSVILGSHGEIQKISWSSSAYKNQEFQFLNCEGRLYVDLLTIIRREYNFETYSLKNVSTHFLGQTKDPLTPKGIFKCYKIFSPKSLGIVGKYCVQDSNLVLKLFEHLQTWIGLCEMSKICNTNIFSLYTQGQQLKIFSQVYKECMYKNYVVERDGFVAQEDEHYTGAYVFDPIPGIYDMVVSFDFSSLYPSTIIAYNIDYTTLVRDDTIPDDMCHIFEWTDHMGCEHDKTIRKTKVKNKLCASHRYRFLKSPKGIIPTLLENLLNSRKQINASIKTYREQLKTLSENTPERKNLETTLNVLDKRQLSMKISANSMYGGFGVKRGYLPFMPGAMCTTARGRESIEKAAKHLQTNYGASLIYGDTDSCYINFSQFRTEKDAESCYNFCVNIENEMLSLFPRPMKLAYEEKIYWRFFILTKKRYMALQCNQKGVISNNIFKRGVLLNRRDSNKILRNIYSELIMKIFYKEDKNLILDLVVDRMLEIFQLKYTFRDFVSTKSIGKLEDYKIRELPQDEKKRQKRLQDLNCTQEEYTIKCLPAHVQLAERMKKRGKRVDAGTRLEFIITKNGGINANLFEKIEDVEYFSEHSEILKIDYFYYINLFTNPLDQIIETAFGIKKYVKQLYEIHLKKEKVVQEIKSLGYSKIVFN